MIIAFILGVTCLGWAGMNTYTAENIFIKKYLGYYNGYYAVRYLNNLSIRPNVITDPEDYIEEIDGIKFCYWRTSTIHFWKEN